MKIKNLFFEADTATATGSEQAEERGSGLFSGGLKIESSDALKGAVLDPEKKEEPPVKKEGEQPPEKKSSQPPEKLSHRHFAELKESRDKVSKELEALRSEREKEKQEWLAEREKLSKPAIPEDFQKQFESVKAEKERLEKDFKDAFVTRQIREQYTPLKNNHIERLKAIATASGDTTIAASIDKWNYDVLAEFGESGDLTPSQKRDWNRSLEDVARIEDEIAEKSRNSDSTWQELQKKSQESVAAQAHERIKTHVALAGTIYEKIQEAVPALKDAPELSKQIRADLVALAGGEGNERFPAQRIMQLVGEHPILNHICTAQKAKIETLEKTLSEREETIKKLKPSFRHDHVEQELGEEEGAGTGAFAGGLKVSLGR